MGYIRRYSCGYNHKVYMVPSRQFKRYCRFWNMSRLNFGPLLDQLCPLYRRGVLSRIGFGLNKAVALWIVIAQESISTMSKLFLPTNARMAQWYRMLPPSQKYNCHFLFRRMSTNRICRMATTHRKRIHHGEQPRADCGVESTAPKTKTSSNQQSRRSGEIGPRSD